MKRHMKSFILFFLSSFLILIFIFLSAAYGQPCKHVEGIVTNKNNMAQCFVQVNFEGPRNNLSMTNSEGKFFMEYLPNGSYKVTIKHGKRIRRFMVTVIDNCIHPRALIVNW